MACDAVIKNATAVVTDVHGVVEERNESLQPDALGVTLSMVLTDWCATKDRRRLRRALLELLVDLERA